MKFTRAPESKLGSGSVRGADFLFAKLLVLLLNGLVIYIPWLALASVCAKWFIQGRSR